MADIITDAELDTRADNVCESACLSIFLAGQKRSQGWVERSDTIPATRDEKVLKNIIIPKKIQRVGKHLSISLLFV